jgi:hypothetical protein
MPGDPLGTSRYVTKYQPGTNARSDANLKRGTMNTAKFDLNLSEGHHKLRLRLDARAPSPTELGNNWQRCNVEFDVPMPADGAATMQCERLRFSPLLFIRKNTASPALDRVRYSRPPPDGNCFAAETIGDSGFSPNANFGFLIRNRRLCTRCHVQRENSTRPPVGGAILCPGDPSLPQSPLANPRNPTLVSSVVLRYFRNPILANIPKMDVDMQGDMDDLLAAYCNRATFMVNEDGQQLTKRADEVLEQWVMLYANPDTLQRSQVMCPPAPSSGGPPGETTPTAPTGNASSNDDDALFTPEPEESDSTNL